MDMDETEGSMNKHDKIMYESVKAHHGEKFAEWLHKNGKLDAFFNSSWGFTHTRYMLAFALDNIPQIEPELTKEERQRIY